MRPSWRAESISEGLGKPKSTRSSTRADATAARSRGQADHSFLDDARGRAPTVIEQGVDERGRVRFTGPVGVARWAIARERRDARQSRLARRSW